MSKLNSLYIRGWKGLAAHTGFHWKTLQKWHYQRARIPFLKTHPSSKYSRWVITPDRVFIWFNGIGENNLENLKVSPKEKGISTVVER